MQHRVTASSALRRNVRLSLPNHTHRDQPAAAASPSPSLPASSFFQVLHAPAKPNQRRDHRQRWLTQHHPRHHSLNLRQRRGLAFYPSLGASWARYGETFRLLLTLLQILPQLETLFARLRRSPNLATPFWMRVPRAPVALHGLTAGWRERMGVPLRCASTTRLGNSASSGNPDGLRLTLYLSVIVELGLALVS